MKKYSTIKRNDNSELVITDYEQISIKKTITIKYTTILLIVVTLVAMSCFIAYYINENNSQNGSNTVDISTETSTTTPTVTSTDIETPFSNDGYIFPRSDSQYLTIKDIEELKNKATKSNYTYQDLLSFSINEIYARHGLKFVNKIFSNYYSQYQWYLEIEKTDTVTWDKFNTYEQSNIALLVEEEKQNGFR